MNEFDETKVETLSPTIGGDDTQSDTFVFTTIPQVEDSTTYNLNLSLNVTGRSTQDVDLALVVDIHFDTDTGIFVVGTPVGTDTGQGTDETAVGHWRTTHELVSITGTAVGVDVVVKTTTSNLGAGDRIVIEVEDHSDYTIASGVLSFDSYSSMVTEYELGDDVNIENVNFSESDSPTDIKTSINGSSIFGAGEAANVIFDEDEQLIIIELASGSEITYIADNNNSTTYSKASYNDAHKHGGNHTATLEGDAVDDIYRRTSETFILRAEQDLISDV